jgi:hypothetical protein
MTEENRGEQKPNMTEQEMKGLKTLRIKEGDITVLNTDKRGKFAITSRETYLELGKKRQRDYERRDPGEGKNTECS